jgi:hypothetical protein
MFPTEFLGHLHPLIVHLPIGILLFAFLLMLFQQFRQVEMQSAIELALLLGAISAVVACVAGWFLAQSGDYEADLVFKHQWTGIATAVLSLLAYFLKRFRWILATATIIVLIIAGHFGGNLTHGGDFLFSHESNKNQQNTHKIDSLSLQKFNIADTSKNVNITHKSFVYQDKIVPILKSKCYNCHSATKKKGGLRLDSEDFIRKGGKNGKILTTGNPEKSALFTHLILPEDDDKHMPPQGKKQLTNQEITAIHFWIKKGALFVEEIETISNNHTAKMSDLNISKVENPLLETIHFLPQKNEENPTIETKIFAKNVEAANPMVLEKLKQQHVSIAYLGEKLNYISANFVNVKNYDLSLLNDLENIDNQLVRLKLSNQPIGEKDLEKLTNFKNLTRLNLENTAITDAALVHLKNLPNLEQLNLYHTNITDKGLEALAKCSNLKVIYLWQTQTSSAGMEQLKKALPNIKIETGGFSFVKPDSNKVK